MREQPKDKGRLIHILNAIEKVEEYTANVEKEELISNSMRMHAAAYNIQIIGEASYKLSKEFKIAHPQTPWSQIEKMRHILVHDYFAVDVEIFCIVITDDIPLLKQQILSYLEEL